MSDRSFYTIIAAMQIIAAVLFFLAYLNSGKELYLVVVLLILLNVANYATLAKNSKPNA